MMKKLLSLLRPIDRSCPQLSIPQMGVLTLFLLIGISLSGWSSSASALSTDSRIMSQRSTPTPEPLPGTEEFGLSMEELVRIAEDVETLIAECMSDAGFEYIAADFNTVRSGMVADKSLPGLSEEEFIDQFGFGISTLYTGQGPQFSDLLTPAQIGLGERNIQIFKNLSPADQVAYNRTLFGEHPDATFAVSLEAEDFSRTGGCTRKAIEQVFRPEQLTATYYNPKDALIEQDPRMAAAIQDFVACMREAGFDYNHQNDIERDFRTRLDAITEGVPLEDLSTEALSALLELQGEERAVAAATAECEGQFIDPVEAQIESELYAGKLG